jgi:hypothetical protein
MIFAAFLMKNSYMFTLLLSFWISLFTANIVHIVLLTFTVVFLTKDTKKQDDNSNLSLSFRNSYWIWLIVYVDCIILSRLLITLLAGTFMD